MRLLNKALLVVGLIAPETLFAYSANKVWLDDLDNGNFRVRVQYTVPALKEFREAQAIYKSKREAEVFYWHLIRGGEFATGGPAKLWFLPPKSEPNPW
ncbi:MAG: hypothetical protein EOP10_22745 [Proteobacteria bacterium]|nr:MAG: hypothetical protein EOP10_22745 [Pseudomonadota bacterium]